MVKMITLMMRTIIGGDTCSGSFFLLIILTVHASIQDIASLYFIITAQNYPTVSSLTLSQAFLIIILMIKEEQSCWYHYSGHHMMSSNSFFQDTWAPTNPNSYHIGVRVIKIDQSSIKSPNVRKTRDISSRFIIYYTRIHPIKFYKYQEVPLSR